MMMVAPSTSYRLASTIFPVVWLKADVENPVQIKKPIIILLYSINKRVYSLINLSTSFNTVLRILLIFSIPKTTPIFFV